MGEGSLTRGTSLRPSALPATTSGQPADDGGGQVGEAGQRVAVLASSVASTASVEYVVQPPRMPTTRNGRASGSAGRDVLGQWDQQPDGEGARSG